MPDTPVLPIVLLSLSIVISIYTLLCFIRILLTWFPGASYTPFGRFLSTLCDPYLNIFRRLRFLRFSAFDLSPALAIMVLYGISYILINLMRGGIPSLGSILSLILSLIWGVVSSVLGFIIILMVIRLLVLFFSGSYGNYGSIWDQLDRAMSPMVYRITSIFTGGRMIPYKTALIIAIIIMVAIEFGGKFLIDYLCTLIRMLPI